MSRAAGPEYVLLLLILHVMSNAVGEPPGRRATSWRVVLPGAVDPGLLRVVLFFSDVAVVDAGIPCLSTQC